MDLPISQKDGIPDSVMREYLEKYEEISQMEKNRGRNEYRDCQIYNDTSNLTKVQKESQPHLRKMELGKMSSVRH